MDKNLLIVYNCKYVTDYCYFPSGKNLLSRDSVHVIRVEYVAMVTTVSSQYYRAHSFLEKRFEPYFPPDTSLHIKITTIKVRTILQLTNYTP
jgi:hypothetical protein